MGDAGFPAALTLPAHSFFQTMHDLQCIPPDTPHSKSSVSLSSPSPGFEPPAPEHDLKAATLPIELTGLAHSRMIAIV